MQLNYTQEIPGFFKFENIKSEAVGRWDGVLDFIPDGSRNIFRVDIELDQPALALGVIQSFESTHQSTKF